MPNNKYRGNNRLRKSPFGNCHVTNWFNQKSPMDAKLIDENLIRSMIFTKSQGILPQSTYSLFINKQVHNSY